MSFDPANLPAEFLRHGAAEPAPSPVPLRAGDLTMLYEDGALRRICRGRVEIVRAVYAAVRDQNWRTVPGQIVNERVEAGSESFTISYERRYDWHGIRFHADCHIEGNKDGVTFAMRGVSLSAFRRNRIGLCVLHPVKECAGQECEIVEPGGTTQALLFPDDISPHQPFLNIQTMRWRPAPKCEATLAFEGEIFETEDQRNWTDASFKTYGTPLALPFPVEVASGERFDQQITLRVSADRPVSAVPADDTIAFTPTGVPPVSLPPMGLCLPRIPVPLSSADLDALRALGLSHLRAELHLSEPDWPSRWDDARRDAGRLGLPLELVLFFGPDPARQARALADMLARRSAPISSLLLLSDAAKVTPDSLAASVVPVLPGVPLGGGTDAFFAELNRERPASPLLDFFAFSANPQVHADDDRTLTENLPALADVVRSARAFAGKRRIHVGPVTLRRRPEADGRQRSLLGAGWTLGVVKHLSEAGADSVTFYETAGARGVLEGAVYPLYFVLREIWGDGTWTVAPSESADPLRVEGLTLRREKRQKTLLANLTPLPQQARIVWGSAPARQRMLNEEAARACLSHPARFEREGEIVTPDAGGAISLSLPPYAVVVLETRREDET